MRVIGNDESLSGVTNDQTAKVRSETLDLIRDNLPLLRAQQGSAAPSNNVVMTDPAQDRAHDTDIEIPSLLAPSPLPPLLRAQEGSAAPSDVAMADPAQDRAHDTDIEIPSSPAPSPLPTPLKPDIEMDIDVSTKSTVLTSSSKRKRDGESVPPKPTKKPNKPTFCQNKGGGPRGDGSEFNFFVLCPETEFTREYEQDLPGSSFRLSLLGFIVEVHLSNTQHSESRVRLI
ncbi:hypothetical protein B0H13DRAFT_2383526 [Mycena leptocephala]|nr:hypothetical protein B0H13DRAFT_2383526 [Mycena leptocephala]